MDRDDNCVILTEANLEALRRSVVGAARGSVVAFTCASITAYSLFSAPPAAAQDAGAEAAQELLPRADPRPEEPIAEPAPAPVLKREPFLRPVPAPAPIFKPVPAPAPIFKPVPAPAPIFKPAPAPAPILKLAPAPAPLFKPAPRRELLLRPQPRLELRAPIWNDEEAIGLLARPALDDAAQVRLCEYLKGGRLRLRSDTAYDRLSAAVRNSACLDAARKQEMASLYPQVFRLKFQPWLPVASVADAISELEAQGSIATPRFISTRDYLRSNNQAVRRDPEYPRLLRGLFATRRLDDPGKRAWLAEFDPASIKAFDSEIQSPLDLLELFRAPVLSARMTAKAEAYCSGSAAAIARNARLIDITGAINKNSSIAPEAKKRMTDALIDAYLATHGSPSSSRSEYRSGCTAGCTIGCTRSCTGGCTAWCTGGCQGQCTLCTGYCNSGCTSMCTTGTYRR